MKTDAVPSAGEGMLPSLFSSKKLHQTGVLLMTNIRKKRWLYLAVFCLINLFAGSLYAWSVLSSPLAAQLTASSGVRIKPSDLVLIFSVASAVNPLGMIAGGWINDRFGPRPVIVLGGLMIGFGLFLSASAVSISELMLLYGVIFGLGVGLTYTSTVSTSIKFFPDKRGLAGGLVSMSFGFSSIFLPPLIGYWITGHGIASAMHLLGLLTGTVIVIGGAVSRRCPSGFAAELLSEQDRSGTADRHIPHAAAPDRNWREMLSTPMFWVMLGFFVSACTGALMLISAASSIAQSQIGMSFSAATLAVSLAAVMNTCGRFIAGMLSDRLGRLPTLFGGAALAVGGFALLSSAGKGDTVLFIVGLSCVVLCFGCFLGIYPGFTSEQFGARHNSVNYGIMIIGFSLGGVLGPWILQTAATPGHYGAAYLLAAVICLAGTGCGMFCLKFRHR